LEEELSRGIGEVLALADSDRDLRSEESVLTLRRRLDSIEKRIEVSGRAYNEVIEVLNASITNPPSSVVARTLGFSTREPFTG